MTPRRLGLAVLLLAAGASAVAQLRGRWDGHATTLTHARARFLVWEWDDSYRVNRHRVSWRHGWPWPYLQRQTAFCPAAADHDWVDESPWAVARGVTRYDPRRLRANVAVCLLGSVGAAAVMYCGGRLLSGRGCGRTPAAPDRGGVI